MFGLLQQETNPKNEVYSQIVYIIPDIFEEWVRIEYLVWHQHSAH